MVAAALVDAGAAGDADAAVGVAAAAAESDGVDLADILDDAHEEDDDEIFPRRKEGEEKEREKLPALRRQSMQTTR